MPGLTEGTMTTTSLNNPLKILLLDSDSRSAKEIQNQLSTDGIKSETVAIESCKQLGDELQKNAYDVIFVSDNARDCSGIVALNTANQLAVATPVVILSEILHEENIINYIHHGASDYVLKSGLQRLASVVQRVVNTTINSKIVDYQHFFENAPDMLCSCDNEGYFMVINPAWEKTLGFNTSDIIGKSYIQFVHPDDRRSAASQYQKLFEANSQSPNLVSRFQTKSGEVKWLHWKMIMHSAGTVDAIVRDVTEFKTREIQLTQTCTNLQKLNTLYKDDIAKKTLVAEQIRDSVIVTNLKGQIVSWNKGSEKIFGYTEKETVGQHIAMIYPQADYKYIQEEATNILLEQGEKEFSLHMLRKSGEVFEARLKLEVTRDKDGTVNGMLGYAIDMGPVRPVANQTVEADSDELSPTTHAELSQVEDQTEQTVGDSNLALEPQPEQQTNEPVPNTASALTQVEPLTAETSEPPNSEAEQPQEHAAQQLAAPHAVQPVDSSNPPLEPQPELQAHQIQSQQPQLIAEQTHEPAHETAPDPALTETTAEPLTTESHEPPIQALSEPTNTPSEAHSSAVSVATVSDPLAYETQDQTTQALLVDDDNNQQSPMDEHRAMPQSDALPQNSVVQDNDAQNNVTEDMPVEEQVISEKVFVPRADGSKITIMYLEDNMNHICQVEKVLAQRKGYLLITTQEPEDWLDMAKQYTPALILLDMDLPDADGYALRKSLLEHEGLKHIPVVAVSSDNSDAAVNSAKRADFSDYLGKPIEANRLFNTIDTLLYAGKASAI